MAKSLQNTPTMQGVAVALWVLLSKKLDPRIPKNSYFSIAELDNGGWQVKPRGDLDCVFIEIEPHAGRLGQGNWTIANMNRWIVAIQTLLNADGRFTVTLIPSDWHEGTRLRIRAKEAGEAQS